jgi:hypothetical protein
VAERIIKLRLTAQNAAKAHSENCRDNRIKFIKKKEKGDIEDGVKRF